MEPVTLTCTDMVPTLQARTCENRCALALRQRVPQPQTEGGKSSFVFIFSLDRSWCFLSLCFHGVFVFIYLALGHGVFFQYVFMFFCFHFSPNSLLLGVLNALKNGRLGAGWSGRVPGRLVSHFLSFVSQFFSFVSQAGLWSWVVVGFPAGLSPTSFHLSPTSFHCLPGWVLVVGFPAGLSPTSFICLPLLFTCLPGWVLVVGFPAGLSPTSFHLSPRLGACGRVPAGLSPTSFHLSPTSFQAGRFWSGSRLACLPLPFVCLPLLFICLPLLFICLPGWVLVVGFPAGLSPTSFHVSPTFSPSSLLLGVLNSFLRCVRPLCHCWCPPISTSISIHLSPRSAASLAKHDPNPQAGVAILIPPGWVLTVEKTLDWCVLVYWP